MGRAGLTLCHFYKPMICIVKSISNNRQANNHSWAWIMKSTNLSNSIVVGGKVSVTCMDERSRVVFYASDLTDEKGQFDLIMNKYTTNGKEVKANRCSLRLVSCPDATCNVPTNFGGGRSGVKLNRPSLVYRDLVKYTLGPFYYTSPMCEKYDTTRYDDRGNGRNY